jgi:hypothetical protein
MAERESLESALARVRFFVDADDREWVVRYPVEPFATLELVPLSVASMAADLLGESAELVVLSSAYLGHRQVIAECFGLDESRLRSFTSDSPFSRSSSDESSTVRSGRCRKPRWRDWSRRCSPRSPRSWPPIRARRG